MVKRLTKEAVRDRSLSGWHSFIEGIQFVKEYVLFSIFKKFHSEPFDNFFGL